MPQCPLCHKSVIQNTLCDSCSPLLLSIQKSGLYCQYCGRKITHGERCAYCMQQQPYLDRFWASYNYQAPITKLIQQWKFNRKIQLSNILAHLMLANPPTWLTSFKIDYILPMPITMPSYQQRLFNQSYELSFILAKRYHLAIIPNHLISKHNDKLQHHLDQKERVKNLKNAFKIHTNLKGLNLLIVDDVATTLTTLTELSKTLKQNNCSHIYSWVLAH